MVAWETSITAVDNTMSQRPNANITLGDKLEDLENRERRNNLRFIRIPKEVVGDNLIQFLVTDLPFAFRSTYRQTPY